MASKSMATFKHGDTANKTFIGEVFKNSNGIKLQRNIIYKYVNDDKGEYALDLISNDELPFAYVRNDDNEYVMISSALNMDYIIEKIKNSGEEATPDKIMAAFRENKMLSLQLSNAAGPFEKKV